MYGTLSSYIKGEEMEAALAQDVTTGKAEIITTLEGQEPKRYEVQIEKIALNSDDPNRNMVIHVTDPELLEAHRRHCAGHERKPYYPKRQVHRGRSHTFW